MGDVISIDANLPHFVIQGEKTHVVPVETIRLMSEGKIPLIQEGQEDIDADMIRAIIREWLEG